MPQILESEAIALAQNIDSLDDARKAKSLDILKRYQQQQRDLGEPEWPTQAKQQAEAETRFRSMFDAPEKVPYDPGPYAKDPNAERASYANAAFIANRYNVEFGEAVDRRRFYMDDYAAKKGQKSGLDEMAFYNLAKGEVAETKLAEETRLEGAKAALRGEDVIGSLQAWQGKNLDRLAGSTDFTKGYLKAKDQAGDYLPMADELLKLMESQTGQSNSARTFDTKAASRLDELAVELASMKPRERKQVYASIAARSEMAGYEQKGFWSQMLGELDKGLLRMSSTVGTTAGNAADVMRNFPAMLAEGATGNRDFGMKPGEVANTDETIAQRQALGEIHDELASIVSGTVDPVRPTIGWLNDTVETGLIKGPGAVMPFMAATAALGPWGGGMLFTADFAEQNRRDLRAAGMDNERAIQIGTVAAPLQAAVESLSNMLQLGKFTKLQSVLANFAKPIGGGAGLALRYAQNAGISLATEYTEEQLQDNFIVPAVQEIVGALAADVPEVDWSFYKTRAAESTPELLSVLAPMALVFGGVMTGAQANLSREMTSNIDALKALNYSEAQATEIVAEKTEEGRIAKASSMWGVRAGDKTTLEEGARSLSERMRQLSGDVVAQQQELERRGILPRMLRATEDQWRLTFQDGSTAAYNSHAEADAARWTWTEDQLGKVHALTRETLSSMERNLDVKREIGVEFSPDARTAQDAVNDGVSVEQMSRRVKQGAALGDVAPDTAFDDAQAIDKATADSEGFLSSLRILGSSRNEFKDGVLRTTIRLWEGSNVLTLVEEKLEGDAKAIISERRGRDWMLSRLRSYEETSGDKLFRDVPDEQLKDDDIIEAWSHLGQSYLVGRSTFGEPLQAKTMRRFGRLLMRAGFTGAMNSEASFFEAVVGRAKKLGELQKAGKLGADLTAELEKQLGIDSQVAHDAGAEAEARQLIDTSGYSEETPGPNGETFSISSKELRVKIEVSPDSTTLGNLGITEGFHANHGGEVVPDFAPRASKQGRKGQYAGFYLGPAINEVSQYGQNVSTFPLNPNTPVKVLRRPGQVERITPEMAAAWRAEGFSVVVGPAIIPSKIEIATLSANVLNTPGPNGETFSIGRVKNGGRLLTFEKPIATPLGRVVSYEWQSDVIEDVDKDGEAVLKRVSDWDKAVSNAETGRAIVHHFTVIQPDGSEKIVSLESALKATKGTETGKALSAAVKAARRFPLREAELTELEKTQGDYDAAIKEANSQGWRNAPEPELRTPEFPPLAERGVKAVYVGDQFIKNLESNELGSFLLKWEKDNWKKQWAVGQLQRPPYGTLDRIQTLRRLIKKDKALIDGAAIPSKIEIATLSANVLNTPGPNGETFSIRQLSDSFQEAGKFYRIVHGEEAFRDVIDSGMVRTNATAKAVPGASLMDKLKARPTAFPSFSKDYAAMHYARSAANHFIIVTEDASLQPSTHGRHSKGKTYFPTNEQGEHLSALPADKVDIFRHIGDGMYQLAFSRGKVVSDETFSLSRATPADASNVVQMPDGARLVGPTTFSVADYGINHRPSNEGPRAFDLLEGGISPSDVYQHPEWYSGMGAKVIRETMAQLRKVKGNPKAKLTIYRAGPKGEMNGGDWVSLSKEYARTHAESQDPEGFKVWQAQVAADSVRWSLDDLAEFGYFGDTVAANDSGETFSIRAYHGTPHKVDKFSLDKIGTGEGAQAYGWGLYFAQGKTVAESYQKADLEKSKWTIDGKAIELWRQEDDLSDEFFALDWVRKVGSPEKIQKSSAPGYVKDAVKKILDNGRFAENSGNLYTVELLPDESEFLDWDKPLSEQSEKVKAALASVPLQKYDKSVHKDPRAVDIYSWADSNPYGGDTDSKASAEALLKAGVPGIRFLDGNSRGAGEGTYNYVIFDENLVRILEENGKPVGETFSLAVLRRGGFPWKRGDRLSLKGQVEADIYDVQPNREGSGYWIVFDNVTNGQESKKPFAQLFDSREDGLSLVHRGDANAIHRERPELDYLKQAERPASQKSPLQVREKEPSDFKYQASHQQGAKVGSLKVGDWIDLDGPRQITGINDEGGSSLWLQFGNNEVLFERSSRLDRVRATPADASNVVQMPDGARLVGPTTFSIRAFHGTPHKVDRFSLDKIGTGEGAQAYGWGLYFAESREVGEGYRKALTSDRDGRQWSRPNVEYKGEHYTNRRVKLSGIEGVGVGAIAEQLDKYPNVTEAVEAAIRAAQKRHQTEIDYFNDGLTDSPPAPEELDYVVSAIKSINLASLRKLEGEYQPGNLYTVELLPDESEFLDWDRPLSEQSEKVKGVLEPLIARFIINNDDFINSELKGQAADGSMAGSKAYLLLGGEMSLAGDRGYPPQLASQNLAKVGIPGIRFLDGNSRSDGSGTSNYVLFDENLIRILEENGKPVGETFSLRSGDFASRAAAMFSPFQRTPELRMAIARVAKERAMRLGAEWIEKAAVIRSASSINREVAFREADGFDRRMTAYLDSLTPNARQNLEFEPAALEDDPLISAMLDFGKLMSRSTAIKNGVQNMDEFEGAPWLPPAWYSKGSGITPGKMAKAMHEGADGNGGPLAAGDSAADLWDAVASRIESSRKDKAAYREAVQAFRDAKKTARTEAKTEAEAWGERTKKTAGSPKAQRDMLKAALRTLDGILSAAPPEVRARVGGYVKLAGLATDEAMLQEIERRVAKLNVELEKWLKKEAVREIAKILKKGRPDSDPGKKAMGKNADMHALFAAASAAVEMDALTVAGRLADLDTRIASDELTPEQEILAITERGLVELVGNLKDADSGRAWSALETLRDIYQEGWVKWKLKQIEKRENRAGLRHDLITDTGKKGIKTERDAADKQAMTLLGKIKGGFLSLSSFHEVLSYAFGSKSERVTSLVDAERTASGQYEDATQALADEIEALFSGMAGGTLAGERLRFDLAQRTITTAKGEFSQLEAIQALLMWRQEDGQRHMEGTRNEAGEITSSWSYDQAWIDEIEASLTPEARRVMAWIGGKYGSEWQTLNPLYRERYGVNLPHHDNYAPLTVAPMQAKAGEVVDPVSGAAISSGSVLTPGSLRTRSRSAIAEPKFRDALQTLVAHTRQMEYWKAYFDLATEASAILGNREVQNAVRAKGGEEAASALQKWVDAIAQGGFRDASASLGLSKMLAGMTGRAASVGLLGRFSTLLVQSTQLAAASIKMPVGAYLRGVSKLLTGNLGYGEAINSEFIQRRYKSAPPIVRQAMESLGAASRPNQITRATRSLGQLLSGADALFTAGTYALLLDYHRTTGAALGLSGAELEAHAHTEAERATEQVAQPTRMATRSLAELTSTNPIAKVSWAYASEARQKIALMAWAASKAAAEPAQFAKTAFLVFGVGGLMAQILKNLWREAKGDDDESKWDPTRLVLQSLAGPLHGVPLASELMGDKGMLSGVAWAWPALKDVASSEGDMRDVDTLLSVLGLFNDTAAGIAVLSHAGLDAAKVLENATTSD